MVASVIKITKLKDVSLSRNFNIGATIEFFRWTYAENTVIIITSSIPCTRSLVISTVQKFAGHRNGPHSYELAERNIGYIHRPGRNLTSHYRRRFLFDWIIPFKNNSSGNNLVPTAQGNPSLGGQLSSVNSPDQELVITKEVTISVTSDRKTEEPTGVMSPVDLSRSMAH